MEEDFDLGLENSATLQRALIVFWEIWASKPVIYLEEIGKEQGLYYRIFIKEVEYA